MWSTIDRMNSSMIHLKIYLKNSSTLGRFCIHVQFKSLPYLELNSALDKEWKPMYIPGKSVTFILFCWMHVVRFKWYAQVWIYNGRKYVLRTCRILVWRWSIKIISLLQDQNNFRCSYQNRIRHLYVYSTYISHEVYPKLILFSKLLFEIGTMGVVHDIVKCGYKLFRTVFIK